MRVMVIVKATKDSETGIMPSTELLEAMGKYNERLVEAGIMLAGEGLHPSSKGKRVAFDGPSRMVIDGPFARPWNGPSAAPTRCRGRARSRSARCSRPPISARR